MKLVARVCELVLGAVGRVRDLVAERLAVGVSPRFLGVRLRVADVSLPIAHASHVVLLSSLSRGARRYQLGPSHRRLLDAHWYPPVEFQPDYSGGPGRQPVT